MSIAIVIILLVFGVALLVAELFLLPGFGLAGITGFLSLGGSVWLAYEWLAPIYPWAGHATLVAAVVLSALAIYGFIRGHMLEKMALDTKIDSKVEMPKAGKHMEAMENNK